MCFSRRKISSCSFLFNISTGKMLFNCAPKASLILEYVPGFGRSFSHDQRRTPYILLFGFTRCDVTVIL